MMYLKHSLAIAACIIIQCLIVVPANCQVDSNKIDNAAVSPRVRLDSSFQADALYYEAMRARVKNDDREEEKLLSMVVAFNPNASGAYYDLSRLSFKQNRADKATEYIRKAIALNDTNVWYKRQYAEILSLSNKFEEAAAQFMQIAKLNKNNEEDLFKAAKLYQHVGKYDLALTALDQLLKKDPWNEEVLDQKKALYLKKNDVESVANIVRQQIDNNPKDSRFYAELAELYDNNSQEEKSELLYKKLELEFADDALAQYALAHYYKKKNNIAKYTEYTRKVITNKGLDADAQLSFLGAYIMELHNDSVRLREGLELSKALAENNPNNAPARSFYGDVLRMNNRYDEAAEEYKKALLADPSVYNTWETLLITYLNRSTADSMVLYSEKALRLFPNQAALHYLNGLAYTLKKDYTKSVKSINRAIDMLPDDKSDQLADMYVALGDAYNFLKQYPLSDESYDKALKLAPENATLLNNYAYYLSVRNVRLEDAEKMSKKSLDIRKDEPTFLDTYGWILYKQGKNDKALEYIQKAVDLSQGKADGALWEHLGDVNFKMGNIEKAVEYWKKAKTVGSDNPDIDKKINERKLYES